VDSILEGKILTWIREEWISEMPFTFQRDNCSIYTSNHVMSWFDAHDNEFFLLDWPLQRPDLSPIENAWAMTVKIMND
jgi:hypothetical protein